MGSTRIFAVPLAMLFASPFACGGDATPGASATTGSGGAATGSSATGTGSGGGPGGGNNPPPAICHPG
ncbi:MAG: hypothetical protein ABJE95_29820, partial [Byssovorax sp.]